MQDYNGYESLDTDNTAETRICKKDDQEERKNEMIESSYNRLITHEDTKTLPTWFVGYEAKYRYAIFSSSKAEEMSLEKVELMAFNARPSKKSNRLRYERRSVLPRR